MCIQNMLCFSLKENADHDSYSYTLKAKEMLSVIENEEESREKTQIVWLCCPQYNNSRTLFINTNFSDFKSLKQKKKFLFCNKSLKLISPENIACINVDSIL